MISKRPRVGRLALSILLALIVGTISLWSAPGVAEVLKVDSALPAYKTASGVSGNLSSIGSDTMNNLMTLWGEQFGKFYPNVKLQIEGKGSSTALRRDFRDRSTRPDVPSDEGNRGRRLRKEVRV